MRPDRANLAEELRHAIEELDLVIESIKTLAAQQDLNPYSMQLPDGAIALSTPVSARAFAIAALANLEVAY